MENGTINILGQEYSLHFGSEEEYPKLKNCGGYTELYSKKIVVGNKFNDDLNNAENLNSVFVPKVLRHEIVHAFLYESGLSVNSDWATNEELVDWIAIQYPKFGKAFDDAMKYGAK